MGRKTDPASEILVTSGSTQVVDLLNWALVNPGDCIVTEDPTFLGSTLNMHNHSAEILTVPCDSEGMRTDILAERLEQARRKARR
jgi:2-aminoadipate transaminase